MQEEYQLVMKKSQDSALKQKKQCDKHVRTALLLPGYRVLIKNMTPHGGPGKLKSYWKEEIHIVESHIGKYSPVYKKVDMVDHEYFIEICCCYALSY